MSVPSTPHHSLFFILCNTVHRAHWAGRVVSMSGREEGYNKSGQGARASVLFLTLACGEGSRPPPPPPPHPLFIGNFLLVRVGRVPWCLRRDRPVRPRRPTPASSSPTRGALPAKRDQLRLPELLANHTAPLSQGWLRRGSDGRARPGSCGAQLLPDALRNPLDLQRKTRRTKKNKSVLYTVVFNSGGLSV